MKESIMSAFQKHIEGDDLADRHLSTRELKAKYPKGHDIFRLDDWLLGATPEQAMGSYWDWVHTMCQRTDLDPADTRETLFD
jgi:hypothetical protein